MMLTDRRLATLDHLVRLVVEEEAHQVRKHGIQTHTPFEWSNFITEELGELAQAIGDHYYRGASRSRVIHEAIQVATLALKIAEMYGTPEDTLARRVGRRGPPPPKLTEEEEDALAEFHAQGQEERERQEARR